MKSLWLHLVKRYLKIGLWFYFRRIRVIGRSHLNSPGPALILGNHQNALLDALLIGSTLDEFGYFLTRAGVFKKPWVAKLLATFNMLPIYRIRDGWSNLTQNNQVFEKAEAQLLNQKKIIIFPEGGHSLIRRVRPLSKGFTRIVRSTLQHHPDLPLQLIPVGFNYQYITGTGDEVKVCIGNPIQANALIDDNEAISVRNLKAAVFEAMQQLTTNIPEENYEALLKKLQNGSADFTQPEALNSWLSSTSKAEDFPSKKTHIIRQGLVFTYKISVLPVYLFWKWYVQPKIKELEFTSTFRYAVCLVLIPFWIIAMAFSLYLLFGFQAAIYYSLIMIFFTVITAKL